MLTVLLLVACNGGADSLTANAGGDSSIRVGEHPHFDACASTGEIVNYKWTILQAPDKMDEDDGKVVREVESNCSFTLEAEMVVDEVGPWELQLEVRDVEGNTAVDNITVTVTE